MTKMGQAMIMPAIAAAMSNARLIIRFDLSERTLEDPHRHHVAELGDPRHGHKIDGAHRDDVNVGRQL